MKKMVVKVLEGTSVIVALIVGAFLMNTISVESLLRGKEEPVTLAMTEDGLQEDFIGLPAGDDIPRITSLEDWDNTWAVSCVTIEPVSIIPTGIGARYSWVSAYTNASRRGGARRKADVTRTSFARQLKAGKSITLPVGKKDGVHGQVLANIQDLCDEYDVNTEGVFYCINDKWNQSHSLMVPLIRIGIILGTALVLGTILIMIVDKIFKVKD